MSERASRRTFVRRLGDLLAERSRRGRAASYVLVGVVAAVALGLVLWWFPHRGHPTVDVRPPGLPADADVSDPVAIWPGMRIALSGRGFSSAAKAEVRIDGRLVRTVRIDADGGIATTVPVPLATRPGEQRLEVLDIGTGRRVHSPPLDVRKGDAPALDVNPPAVTLPARVAVRAGGLPHLRRLRVELVAQDGAATTLAAVRSSRAGLISVVVAIPPTAARGASTVHLRAAAGADAAPAATLEISR